MLNKNTIILNIIAENEDEVKTTHACCSSSLHCENIAARQLEKVHD